MTPADVPCGHRTFRWSERTYVMGVVNVTPDSFSDGGRFLDVDDAVAHAHELLAAGADVLDLGAESTRPGATPISADEECARLLPVITRLVTEGVTCLSVDTYKASVAEAALAAGASWINDVTGLSDPAMATAAARADALVLMHSRPMTAGAVEDRVQYGDVVVEVAAHLDTLAAMAVAAGVQPDRLLVDPGIGFGKTVDDNVALLAGLPVIAAAGRPVLVGTSRKRFLGVLSGAVELEERDAATVGACCAAAERGAHMVRVHDVRGTRLALAVVDAVRRQHGGPHAAE